MKRWWIIALAALSVSGMDTPGARAQFPIGGYSPPQTQARPPFSPYLNLARPGVQAGINYYGLVRPQLQTQQQLQNLQYQQNVLATDVGTGMAVPGQPVPIATTGHPVYYFDFARYFPLGGLPSNMGTGFGTGVPAMGGGAGFGRSPLATPGIGVVAPVAPR